MLTTLTDPAYKDLPGKENIIAALTTPTKTNVAALQVFLEGNINNADAKKKLIDTSKKGDIWDGKYGVNTDIALNAYLTEYTQFTAIENGTTAQKAAAEEAANAVITSTESINALNTSKATAKKKLDEAFATYKETDYTQTNWKTLTDARATGQKSIDDATTADLATNGQTTAEAIMKSIPTKTQETKTNTEKIDKTQNNLTKLQDSTAFKNLPNNIQRQVNRILNLTKRDDKVDAKIAESQKEVTDINNKIVTINTDTMNK
jgi:predicted  nucleic acid-binding Zn-ribbon protein